MANLLQIKTCGLKNIESPIVLEFSNQTLNKGFKKINNVKGIYGYNGAGKTALITSVYFYKNIVTNPEFLFQNNVKNQLQNLINKKVNEFSFSSVFNIENNFIIRHTIILEKKDSGNDVILGSEKIELLVGRTLNEKFKPVLEKKGDKIDFTDDNESVVELTKNSDLSKGSIIGIFIRNLLKAIETDNDVKPSALGTLLIRCFLFVNSIQVSILKSDNHSNRIITKKQLLELTRDLSDSSKAIDDNDVVYNANDIVIKKENLLNFEKTNAGLEKFLKIFKPELLKVKIEKVLDRDFYHIRRIFSYKDYEIDFEYESSGIKQLVKLYSYLKMCADGNVVFIDEMDVNINAVYFKKLVSYFLNFGKGQLIFTTHNIESMDAIKNQRRAINVIGYQGHVDTWVGVGNRSPINDYVGGYFVHSPMNIEDFDFVSVFEGE